MGAADNQEKIGGVPCSQAQDTEQVRFLEWPGSRAPGMRILGLWVKSSEEKGGDAESGGRVQVRA